MRKQKLGNSDLEITKIGFGAWAIGGPGYEFGWGKQVDNDSIKAIHKALEMGVNWIDTAAVYGLGHSESVVAEALKQWNGEKPFIFTKCSLIWDEKRNVIKSHDPVSLKRECENSLKRLNVDTIDLYQVHWPPEKDNSQIDDAWKALTELKEEGKVRWIGVSNFNVEQMERTQKISPVTSLQPPYSLLRRKIEHEVLPFCKQNNIGVIVYSPMASGMLTGAMTKERAENLPGDDWRKGSKEFVEPRLSKNLLLVEKLKHVGKKYDSAPGEVAIAWTLKNSAVTGAIVGARNAKQVEGVFRASELELKDEDVKEIENMLK